MSPNVIVPRGPRLELYPDMSARDVERRRFTNALLDNWEACLTAHGSVTDLHRKIERIRAKLDDPANAHIPAGDPLRVKAERRLAELRRLLGEAIDAGPTATSIGGLKHRLACFSGLLIICQPTLVAMYINSFGGRGGDADHALLETIYRNPDLVEGQALWPEIIETYEEAHAGEPNPYWRESRRRDEEARQELAAGGMPDPESAWRKEWRRAKRAHRDLADVPF